MAINPLTLVDTLLINDQNNADISPSHILNESPLLQQITPVEATNGNIHKYIRYTTAPTVGFRQLNLGRELQSSADTQVTVDLSIMDASFATDIMNADASRLGVEGFLRREAIRHLQAAMFKIEQTIFTGVTGVVDAAAGAPSGFDGLDVTYGALLTAGNSAGFRMVEDIDGVATVGSGTESNYTSAYFLRMGEDAISLIVGNGMSISISPTIVQALTASVMTTSASATNVLPVYYTPITGYFGLQIGSVFDACRVANISLVGASGKHLDDDKLFSALARFPSARMPNVCVMNRAALNQLRDSRTATNVTGAPAPRPTEIDGIPIVVTDAISSTQLWLDATS